MPFEIEIRHDAPTHGMKPWLMQGSSFKRGRIGFGGLGFGVWFSWWRRPQPDRRES